MKRVDGLLKRLYELCSDRLITWVYSLIDCIYDILTCKILIKWVDELMTYADSLIDWANQFQKYVAMKI
jgi:hypothetical protein